MKYLFITNSGETLPIAYRLVKEKQNVMVYIHNPKYQTNYDKMIKKVKMGGLPGAVNEADLVVFDMNKPAENKHDRALQKTFGATGSGLYGSIADRVRDTGKVVFGASAYTEGIELDRNAGSELARKIKIKTPRTLEFLSLSEGTRFLKNQKNLWAFKPHENQDLDLTYVERFPGELALKLSGEYKKRLPEKIDYILQEKVNGVEISTEAWWRGDRWCFFNHTIEDKEFMNGGHGPRVGSMLNTVWLKTKKGLLTDAFERLTPKIKRSGYLGPIDINCIVSEEDQIPYFLEFTPRMGYDAIYCLLSLLKSPMYSFFEYVSGISKQKPYFKRGYASSIRLSIPPYPYEAAELLRMAEGVDLAGDLDGIWLEDVKWNNGYQCCGVDGIIGVVAKHGNSLGGSVGNAYRQIEKIQTAAYTQYRTDAGKRARKAIKRLEEWKITID